jgi:hypothetical protein
MTRSLPHVKLATALGPAVLLLITACSTSGSGGTVAARPARSPSAVLSVATSSTAARTASPSTTAPTVARSTVPAVPTVKVAGQHYLQLVAPANRAGKALDDAAGWTRLSTVRKPLTGYITALDVFSRGLLSYPWPASAMPAAKRLATANLAMRADLKRVLSSQSDVEAVGKFNAAIERDQSIGIATELRIALGLPSN